MRVLNKEDALKIANKLLSMSNDIEWDNEEQKWYLDSEQCYDDIMDLSSYVINTNS